MKARKPGDTAFPKKSKIPPASVGAPLRPEARAFVKADMAEDRGMMPMAAPKKRGKPMGTPRSRGY